MIRAVNTLLIVGSTRERSAQIAALLAARSPGERWAILAAARALVFASEWACDEVIVRNAPFGCFGCMPEVPLRVALVRLLREARPVRLLIEIDSPLERARAITLVAGPAFAGTLVLERR